ncbi:MAG: dihydrodipicolinate synthase family protein, partial [candidate division KSB1 bacterium]
MPLNLKGVFPPAPTPFANGHFSPRHLAENLKRWNTTGLSGYVVLGSNGEAPLLSDAERLEVVRVARKEIPSDQLLLVGTGMESTEATVVLTMRVADLGAEAALVVNPFYYGRHLSHDALRRYFETVAEASPIPLLLYNVPKFTNMNLPVELVVELAQHPNIIGMKDSAGNLAQLVELRAKTPPEFQILIGSDAVFFAGLLHGMDGAILALANVAPRECVMLYECVNEKKWEAARTLAEKLA